MNIEIIGEKTVNQSAVKTMYELSKRHPYYTFCYTNISALCCYLPKFGVVLEDNVSPKDLDKLEDEYEKILSEFIEKYKLPMNYEGIHICNIKAFNTSWLSSNEELVIIRDGVVMDRSILVKLGFIRPNSNYIVDAI